jgi:hypothetical protein
MTTTEKAQKLSDTNAQISKWTAMPRSEYRTRALRTLKLNVKYLNGEKVPAYIVAAFEG